MLREFKEFIARGNVIDLAVAVVLGAAFTAVVNSFTNDILLQLVAAIGGQPDFSNLVIDVGDGRIYYGRFLTAVVSFLIVGFGVFLVVKAINAAQRIGRRPDDEKVPTPRSDEAVLLEEIRDLLRTQASTGKNT